MLRFRIQQLVEHLIDVHPIETAFVLCSLIVRDARAV